MTDEQKREAVHAKGGEMDRHGVEAEENIRLELYRALVAAVGVRLTALEAIAKAEGREEPACDGAIAEPRTGS